MLRYTVCTTAARRRQNRDVLHALLGRKYFESSTFKPENKKNK